MVYLIYIQVVEEIVVESNSLIRSVQVILDALNELRLCHVMERATSAPSKTEGSKVNTDATNNILSISFVTILFVWLFALKT